MVETDATHVSGNPRLVAAEFLLLCLLLLLLTSNMNASHDYYFDHEKL
jgi:hypothetical protein